VVEAAPTNAVWRALADGDRPSPVLEATTDRLARDYALFHWELAFPQVFERGGFDVVLGNPPWERVKLQEQEFFASRDDTIAGARNAAERKRLINELPVRNPELADEWNRESRVAQGTTHFVRQAGRYPLCGKGDINTYALFAEHNWRLVGPRGRAGFIVPSGIATDDTTKEYFHALVSTGSLRSLYDFRNHDGFFYDVGHRRFKFCLVTASREPGLAATLVFFAEQPSELHDPERTFSLRPEDIALLNPNTGTCPTFRGERDARLNLALYRRAGVLLREGDPDGNPWGIRFLRMLDMANDSGLFRTRAELAQAGWKREGNQFVKDGQVMLPLFEAKMVHHFDHRFGDYTDKPEGSQDTQLPDVPAERLANPDYRPLPRYWVEQAAVDSRLAEKWDRSWLLGWRDITNSTNARTLIASVLPHVAVGHKLPLAFLDVPAPTAACFLANLSSFALDYAARQKVGGVSLAFFLLKQFPVLPPSAFAGEAPWSRSEPLRQWLLSRILELTYTAWDLRPFARDRGDEGPPYIWDPDRRLQLQCELDAAFFHLYGVSQDDADYILGTFEALARAETRTHGEFRTRRVVLECYDALAHATTTGRPYVSPLGPPRRATSP